MLCIVALLQFDSGEELKPFVTGKYTKLRCIKNIFLLFFYV